MYMHLSFFRRTLSMFITKGPRWSKSDVHIYFEQKYEKYQIFLSENFQVLEVNFSIYLNWRVFVMSCFKSWTIC